MSEKHTVGKKRKYFSCDCEKSRLMKKRQLGKTNKRLDERDKCLDNEKNFKF